MNRKRILTFLLISSSLLFSCKRVIKNYYPDGKLMSEVEFKFGKENGKATYYSKTGTVEMVLNYKNGLKEGKMCRYFSLLTPVIETEANYTNDLLDGKYSEYNIDGIKLLEIEYKMGKKDGFYTTWHGKGMLKEKGTYHNDLFDGEWSFFDERGFPVGDGKFNMGNGVMLSYDQQGRLLKITNYINNLKNGKEIYFSSKGDTVKVIIFKDDKIIQ